LNRGNEEQYGKMQKNDKIEDNPRRYRYMLISSRQSRQYSQTLDRDVSCELKYKEVEAPILVSEQGEVQLAIGCQHGIDNYST